MSSAISVFDRFLGPTMRSGARQVANPGIPGPCACGSWIVRARLFGGDEVVVDADRRTGLPKLVEHGQLIEVAVQADLLGRRPLCVDDVGEGHGDLRLHRCRALARAS